MYVCVPSGVDTVVGTTRYAPCLVLEMGIPDEKRLTKIRSLCLCSYTYVSASIKVCPHAQHSLRHKYTHG